MNGPMTSPASTAAADSAKTPQYPTNFSSLIKSATAALLPVRSPAVFSPSPAAGKVKVVLCVSAVESGTETCLAVDGSRQHVTLRDPTPCLAAVPPSYRQRFGPAGPRMFAFDDVFLPTDSLNNLCASSLSDVLQAVIGGSDGCVFAFGPSRIGKTYTMIGMDDVPHQMGVIPSAIAALYRLIGEHKESTGARFSVRVSAVEVTGHQESLRDLLADFSSASSSAGSLYLRDDPVSGTHLENQSEVRAPTVDMAAHLLDAAIAARTVPVTEEDARHSHLFFTLNVYQYRVETSRQGQNSVAGGRSRLHLIDLGSCGKSRDNSNTLSLSALGTIITALLSGQRQVPYRERKLTQLLRESLGSASCHACGIVHVSPAVHTYNDTAQVILLASRMHETRLRRRARMSSSSEESSCDGSSSASSQHWYGRRRAGVKMGVRQSCRRRTSHSDPESCMSGSEQSCDTAIFLGSSSRLAHSDREFTDSEAGSSVVAMHHPARTPERPLLPITSPNGPQRITRHAGISSSLEEDTLSSHSGSHASDQLSIPSSSSRRSARYPRTSASPRCPATIMEHPDEEQWVDGPRLVAPLSTITENTSKSTDAGTGSRSSRSRQHQSSGAASGTELWVDGPPEFRGVRESTPDKIACKLDKHQSSSSLAAAAAAETRTLGTTPVSCIENSDQKLVRTESRRTKTESRIPSGPSSKHSSPLPKQRSSRSQLPPPDGRVTAWVQSVQEAALASGSLTEELLNASSSKTVSDKSRTVAVAENNNQKSSCSDKQTCDEKIDVKTDESAASFQAVSNSVYEQQMDECLETGSAAVASSDDDGSVWDSAVCTSHTAAAAALSDRTRDGVADGQVDVEKFTELSPDLAQPHQPNVEESLRDSRTKFSSRTSMLPISSRPSSTERSSRPDSTPNLPPKCHRSASSPRRMTSTPKKSSSAEKVKICARSASLASSPSRLSDASCSGRTHHPSTDALTSQCDGAKERSGGASKLQKKNIVGRSTQLKTPTNASLSITRSVSEKLIVSSPKSSSRDRRSRVPTSSSSARVHRSATASPDSGVVAVHRLLSPYHAVTRPRRAVGCSVSSDNSSLLSDPTAASKSSEVEVSSGYESILRDDVEDVISVPSSCHETASECSSESRLKMFRNKAAASRHGGPLSPHRQHLARLAEASDVEGSLKLCGVWVENERRRGKQLELSERRVESDIRQIQEAEAQLVLRRIQRVDELLERQQALRADLLRAKSLLMVDSSQWSFDLPVADSDGDRADPTFLHQLEVETDKLEKRVRTCQSRIMMVTCFDSAV